MHGAHAQNACGSCHPRTDSEDAHGRTLGRVAEHFGVVTNCSSCHADPHRGRFDREGCPPQVEGRSSCARCHNEVSFRALGKSFDHALWTNWKLDGTHATTSCAKCHAPLRRPDSEGRTWSRAKGTSCASCHDDPHAGQFEVEGATDCSVCHSSTSSFQALSFDHNEDSSFALDETHAALACDACHRSETSDEIEFVRYKPLGTSCVDCHGTTRNRLRHKKKS